MNPSDPDLPPPDDGPNTNGPADLSERKPWEPAPLAESNDETGTPSTLDVLNMANGIDIAANVGGAALDATGTAAAAAAGVADVAGGVADMAGGAADAAGSALDAAGGLLDGCGSCSLALLGILFAATGTALALFR